MKKEWLRTINYYPFLLTLLTLFLIVSRLFGLGRPSKHYFDEVYHAFTAQQMLLGNKTAWEWWNTPPPGFAYEWTHPPIAKLGMVLGMKVFGNRSLGWRLPGAFLGIGAGLLLYAISQKLFANRFLSFAALFFYTLDGLPLAISRIGMNDIYLIFFLLLTTYLLLKQKFLAASLSLGLMLASKWSAVYFLPIYLFFLVKHKKYLYVFIPPLIYLFSYLPFFTTGHSWTQFVELQKQMWWYHTRLKATHNYSSPAYTWPIMYRPVWAYVDYQPSSISNIYIMGNPLLWWVGFLAVVYQTIKSIFHKKVSLPVIGYWLFLLPWIFSPRIMFLYHYLPSAIFMYILLAQTLVEFYPKYKKVALGICVLGFVAFVYFFPHWTGIPVSSAWASQYYWLSTWK